MKRWYVIDGASGMESEHTAPTALDAAILATEGYSADSKPPVMLVHAVLKRGLGVPRRYVMRPTVIWTGALSPAPVR